MTARTQRDHEMQERLSRDAMMDRDRSLVPGQNPRKRGSGAHRDLGRTHEVPQNTPHLAASTCSSSHRGHARESSRFHTDNRSKVAYPSSRSLPCPGQVAIMDGSWLHKNVIGLCKDCGRRSLHLWISAEDDCHCLRIRIAHRTHNCETVPAASI